MNDPFQSGLVEAVYVIHVAHFIERGLHVKAQMAKFDIPFEFVETYDPAGISPGVKQRFLPPDSQLSIGQLSCALKHLEALRRIVAKQHKLALVLEDDALLADDFCARLAEFAKESQTHKTPHTVQIGCANNMYVAKQLVVAGQFLYEADRVRATDAYLINGEAARLRLNWLENNKIDRPIDHLFSFIDPQLGIDIYWSDPTIVEQGSMSGVFPTHIDPKRLNQSIGYIRWRYKWQRFRKKYLYRFFQRSSKSGGVKDGSQ